MTGPFQLINHHIITDDIEFFLGFTLNIFSLGITTKTNQTTAANEM